MGIDFRELVPGRRTGIGRYLLSFLSEATRMAPDFEFWLYADSDIKGFNLPRTRLKVVPGRLTPLWDQYHLPRALEEDEVDLFFSPYYKAPIHPPCPAVVTIHDLLFLHFPKNFGERFLKNPLFKRYASIILRKVQAVITDSNCSKRDILEHFLLPEDKIKVIYPGVDSSFAPKNEKETEPILKKYGLEKGYLLYVGNFKPHKNLPLLLSAYAKLPDKIREKHPLLLVGGDEQSARPLKKMADSLSLKVKFLHFVPDEELSYFYSAASIFIFPSLYEGFGYPPLEAMACGTPVIVSSSSSLTEVVGDAGFYFPPTHPDELTGKIKLLIADRNLRKELSIKGRRRAAMFTTKKMTEGILSLFIEVLERVR